MFFTVTAIYLTLLSIDLMVAFYLMNKYTDYREWKGINDNRVDRVFLIGIIGMPLFLTVIFVWCMAVIYG